MRFNRNRRNNRQRVKTGTGSRFRSKYEALIAKDLDTNNIKYEYEADRFAYPLVHVYTPDFFLPNGVIIETKGKFTGKDRTKLKNIKLLYPDLDIRLLFQRNNRLSTKSKTTYLEWAEKNQYIAAVGNTVPKEWYGKSKRANRKHTSSKS